MPTAPGAFPLLGHLPRFIRDPLQLLRALPEYGDLVCLRLGGLNAVVVCDPELTRQVLADDKTFDKGGQLYQRFQELAGDNVGACSHSRHRRQRRLVQPAFHPGRMPAYAQVMVEQFDAVSRHWADGQIIDVLHEAATTTVSMLGTTMFSDTIPSAVMRQTLEDLHTVMSGATWRMVAPMGADRLPTPGNLRYHRARARLRGTLDTLIAQRRASGIDNGDLISALLAAQDPDGAAMSDIEISDNALGFFIAGSETTANTLAWALHLLDLHPAVDARVYAEVDRVLQGRAPAHTDLAALDLTRRVVLETLRLMAPAWMFTRVISNDARLGTHDLPAGTTVVFSPYLVHHLPGPYPEPERFDPDRWLDERTPDRTSYIPFGAGARKCVGDKFALMELTLILARVVSKWRLRHTDNHAVRPALAAVLRPRKLRMRLDSREPRLPTPAPSPSPAAE
ncbi:cytochrome P450 [Nocardia brasiliensis]|uniref:cytochrome P450 n=1 Tax=Nocardia brasiliensis TaxID=37326 RepID=UPI0037AE9785